MRKKLVWLHSHSSLLTLENALSVDKAMSISQNVMHHRNEELYIYVILQKHTMLSWFPTFLIHHLEIKIQP